MEYAKWGMEKLTCGMEVVADTSFQVTPEDLVDEFVSDSSPLEERTHSNRAIWPETELDGVKFDVNSPSFKGEIRPSYVEIRVDDLGNADAAIEQVASWFQETRFEFPSRDKFKVESMWCTVDDNELGLTVDSTKCERSGMGCEYIVNGKTSEYLTVDGYLTIMFGMPNTDMEGVERHTAIEHVKKLFSEDRILIGPLEEIESEGDSGENY